MRYKTLFRVLLKVLGVWLVINGLGTSALIAFQLAEGIFERGFPNPGWQYWGWQSRGVLQLIAGLYLFFGGRWIADKAIPSNRPYCHDCGYDLSTSARDKCPECGTPVGVNQRDS